MFYKQEENLTVSIIKIKQRLFGIRNYKAMFIKTHMDLNPISIVIKIYVSQPTLMMISGNHMKEPKPFFFNS